MGKFLINILCNLGVVCFMLLDSIASSGFWSCFKDKVACIKKMMEFFHGTMLQPRTPILLPHNLFGLSVSALLVKYTGLSSCNKQVPSPLILASVCKIVFMDYNRLGWVQLQSLFSLL